MVSFEMQPALLVTVSSIGPAPKIDGVSVPCPSTILVPDTKTRQLYVPGSADPLS